MHIEVDPDLCQAYGNCLLAAPEVFELTESMPVVLVRSELVGEIARDQVEEAVQSCPVQALTLRDQ